MEILGINLLTLILGVLGGIFLGFKVIAPKTENKIDDQIVDAVEGLADAVGVDAEEVAEKSTGRLKKKILKK